MKAKTLQSKWEQSGAEATYTLTDVAEGASQAVRVPLGEIFAGFADMPAIAQKALAFGTRTRLRNSTGGATFAEALETVKGLVEEMLAGSWAAARATGGGETRASIFVEAISRASNGKYTVADALALYDAKVEEVAKSRGIDLEDDSDENVKAINKVRSDVRKAIIEKAPAVELAMLDIKREREDKKRAAISAKAGASGFDL